MAVTAKPPRAARRTADADDPLRPVRAALLASARADAERLLADAAADAATVLADAADQSRRFHEAARAEADRYAAAVAAQQRTRIRREARAMMLAAQRAAYDELRRRAREAASRLRDDPGYPAMLARLTAQARAQLGADADVREHPDGGVVARARGRRLALTLPALADRAVDSLGPVVEGLWRP